METADEVAALEQVQSILRVKGLEQILSTRAVTDGGPHELLHVARDPNRLLHTEVVHHDRCVDHVGGLVELIYGLLRTEARFTQVNQQREERVEPLSRLSGNERLRRQVFDPIASDHHPFQEDVHRRPNRPEDRQHLNSNASSASPCISRPLLVITSSSPQRHTYRNCDSDRAEYRLSPGCLRFRLKRHPPLKYSSHCSYPPRALIAASLDAVALFA